nr:unnamed protein product [Callosobruchus analis]
MYRIQLTLDAHIKRKHSAVPCKNNKFSTCLHCDIKFVDKRTLDAHVAKKHPNFINTITSRIYECTQCRYSTTYKTNFHRHLTRHSGTASSNKHVCIQCDAKFKSKQALDDHVVKKHPNLTKKMFKKIYECSECGFRTILRSGFSRHMSTHSDTVSSNKDIPCAHCNATFNRKLRLDDHVVKKHPNFIHCVSRKIFECKECTFKTVVKNVFLRHQSTHSVSSSKHTCIHCNEPFKSQRALEGHLVRKHPNLTKAVNRKMYETATTKKTYQCIKCTFITTVNIVFFFSMAKCIIPKNEASKSFSGYNSDHSSYSERHTNDHLKGHGIKEYVHISNHTCIHCNSSYKTKKILKAHIRRKHSTGSCESRKSRTCTHCGTKLRDKRTLDDHIVKKHPNFIGDQVTCIYCKMSFENKASLVGHVLRKHPDLYKTIKKPGFNKRRKCLNIQQITCMQCNALFKSQRAVEEHLVRQHPNFTKAINRKLYESAITKKTYQCAKCPFITTINIRFLSHMQVHLPSFFSMAKSIILKNEARKTFSCYKCDHSAYSEAHMIDHLKQHANKEFEHISSPDTGVHTCALCNSSYKTKRTLDAHVKRKHSAVFCDNHKVTTCIHCATKFMDKRTLDNHVAKKHPTFIKSVTSKIYECGQCAFITTYKTNFDRHKTRHPEASSCNKHVLRHFLAQYTNVKYVLIKPL